MKTLLSLTTSIATAILLATSPAHASEGNEGGGGGKGFMCNENGKQKMYLADTYELSKAGLFDRFKGHSGVDFESAAEIIDRKMPEKAFPHPYIRGQKVSFGFILSHVRNGLTFYSNPMDQTGERAPKEFPDDHIKQVPKGCRKIQVALQNLKTGRVHMRNVWQEATLSGADWFYLELHETLIALRNKPGYNTTEIRDQVKRLALILSNPKNFSLAVLQELNKKYDENIKIVPLKQQKRFRTLYYAPKVLQCDVTWIGESPRFPIKYKHPEHITLVRTSGDGRVGEHNKYKMIAKTSWYGIPRKQEVAAFEADFYTESYNAFGEADGIGTFSLTTKFNPNKKVELEIDITSYDNVTGEYIGSTLMESTEGMVIDGDGGDHGLRCWPSERPIFRVDERSSVYGEHFPEWMQESIGKESGK